MADQTNSTRQYLEQRLEALQREMADVVAALRGIGVETTVPGEWSTYDKAIDAVKAYLGKAGKPVNRFKIASDLAAGGFGLHRKRPTYNVLDSIRYHAGEDDEERQLCLSGDDVCLREWTEERTEPQPSARH